MATKFLTTDVGVEVLKDGVGVYHVKQAEVDAFMERKGITKDIMKQITEAKEELFSEAVKFLGSQIIESPLPDNEGAPAPQKLIFGAGNGKMTVCLTPVVKYGVPCDKDTPEDKREYVTKYGVATITVKQSMPVKCQEVCDIVSADMEKAYAKMCIATKKAHQKSIAA